MDFLDEQITLDSRGKKRTVLNPVLFSNSESPQVTIITEFFPSSVEVNSLKRFLDRKLSDIQYQILSPFLFNLIKKEQTELEERDKEEKSGKRTAKKQAKQSVTDFYKKECIDFKKYIPSFSNVVTMKKALYAISGNALRHDYFYDSILELTSFWSPVLKCRVYPISSISEVVIKDTFERKFALSQLDKAKKEKEFYRRGRIENYIDIEDPNKFLLETKGKEGLVSVDLETTGLDFMKHRIVCMTIAFDDITGYYLDWNSVDIAVLSKWFVNKNVIGANIKFDYKFLVRAGVDNIFLYADTMIIHHLMNEMQGHSLKTQAWLFDSCGGYEDELIEYRTKYKINDYSKLPKKILMPYAIKDTLLTFRMYKFFLEKIRLMDEVYPLKNGNSLEKLFFEEAMPALRMFAKTEIKGLCIDTKILDKKSREVKEKLEDLRVILRKDFGVSLGFNFDSPPQLGNLLKAKGWKSQGYGVGGVYKTGVIELTEWAKNHPEAKILLEYRQLMQLFKTFLGEKKNEKGVPSGFYQYLRKNSDGSFRVHSNFGVCMADSLRCRSSNPNFQNLPAWGYSSEVFKSILTVPNDDYVWLSVDLSGLQLRLAAIQANEETMKDIFINQGGILHDLTGLTAVMNNSISIEEFLTRRKSGDEQVISARQLGKTINFLLIFDGKPSLLYKNMINPTWSEEEAIKFVKENNLELLSFEGSLNAKFTVANCIHERFFQTYPKLRQWKEDFLKQAKIYGFVRSPYGSFRRTPYLQYKGKDDSGVRYSNYESIILNSPTQTFESMIVLRAATIVHEWLEENKMKSYLWSIVHDACEFVAHRSEISILARKLKLEFEKDYPEYDGIPMVLEGNVADPLKGQLWDSGEDWKEYLELNKRRRIQI